MGEVPHSQPRPAEHPALACCDPEAGAAGAGGDGGGGLLEPLLPAVAVEPLQGEGDAQHRTAAGEACRLVSLGWPLVVEEVLTYLSTVIAVAMVGQLGAFQLSAFALARSVTNITGISFLVGVTGGIDTFCSQTHGAGGHRLVGVMLQRGICITLCFCLPVLLFYTQAGRVLAAIGQEQALAAAAGRYIKLYSPLIPIHGAALCVCRYLIAQGAVAHVMLAGFVLFVVTPPITWLLIYRMGLGLDGSALAAVVCDAIYLLSLACLAAHHNRSRPPALRPWHGWSREALSCWGPYVRVVLASTVYVALDWWMYDLSSLLAGWLPSPEIQLAAMSVSYNINSLAFMVPFGLSYAVGARVGSSLGAGRHKTAKLSAEVGTGIGLGVMLLLGVALIAARGAAARPFTRDAQVVQLAAAIMPPLALALVANGGSAVLAGVLRGCGRQKLGALANFVVNWVLGLPLLGLLGFKLGLGAVGLWWGLCIASNLQVVVLILLVARFDWSGESERAGRLVRRLSQSSRAG